MIENLKLQYETDKYHFFIRKPESYDNTTEEQRT